MSTSWREDGSSIWREILMLLSIYACILIVAWLVSLLLPLEQRQPYWWTGYVLISIMLGIFTGRGGEKRMIMTLSGVAIGPVAHTYEEVKPLPIGILAAAGMLAIYFIGYGLGILSKRLNRSQV